MNRVNGCNTSLEPTAFPITKEIHVSVEKMLILKVRKNSSIFCTSVKKKSSKWKTKHWIWYFIIRPKEIWPLQMCMKMLLLLVYWKIFWIFLQKIFVLRIYLIVQNSHENHKPWRNILIVYVIMNFRLLWVHSVISGWVFI